MTVTAPSRLATLAAGVPRPAIRMTESAAPAEWRSPAAGLWVGATADGRFVGMIERDGAGYRSTDWAGRSVGSHAALPEAERALEALADVADEPRDPAGRIHHLTASVAAAAAVAAISLAALVAVAVPR
jgi:hypothetical protein